VNGGLQERQIQSHMIIICQHTECEKSTLFARSRRWCKEKLLILQDRSAGCVRLYFPQYPEMAYHMRLNKQHKVLMAINLTLYI
jgi:hypothetical protein